MKNTVMEKKKIYHISEHQASVLINEQMSDPELMKMVGEKTNRTAYPQPISTGKFDGEGNGGVGVAPNKEEKPEVDLKNLPKPQEIKDAWGLLRRASALLVQGAPKLSDEALAKRVQKMAHQINDLVMSVNADMNVNETDLTA
jgi:hypothetical protein